MLDNLKGYKTIGFFVLTLVVAVANFYGFADFHLTADQTKAFEIGVPLIGIALRYVTNSPIFKKPDAG